MDQVKEKEILPEIASQEGKIVLDMEAISLLTRNNWLFSRFDIDERVYIFHWPETGEKCELFVVGDDDMFISAREMREKIPQLQDSIDKLAFTPLTSSTLSSYDGVSKLELVISHPDDIEHDLFFIAFSTLNYLTGGSGFNFVAQDNASDTIYDLKRFNVEMNIATDDESVRFQNFWQKLTPFLEIFMTRSANLSVQNRMLKLLGDQAQDSTNELYNSLQNLLKGMAEKVGVRPDYSTLEGNDYIGFCNALIDTFHKRRFFRETSKETEKSEKIALPNSYYQKLKDPANYPVPNKKAMQVYFISCREDTDYEELVDSIKEDPALTAKILKLLNTPMFRTSHSISSISIEALSLLGLPRIKEIAMNVAIDFSEFEVQCESFDHKTFYQNSLACAIAARNITSYVNKTCPGKSLFTPEQAYTVGLLSQVGKLAFASVCPQAYNRMLKENTDCGGQELCEMEKKEFGIDHCEIAADMLSEWSFAESFCKAIRYQYQYPDNQTIFKDDVVASALASKLKAASFMLRWSNAISATINSREMAKKQVITTLDKAAKDYGICPGNYHMQSVATQKEWRTMRSVMEI